LRPVRRHGSQRAGRRAPAGSWHIGFALADPDRPGQWQALYASGQPLARAVGPIVLTTPVVTWSGPGWIVLAAVFACAGSALRPVAHRAHRLRTTVATAPAA
jgi:hypothetical protein